MRHRLMLVAVCTALSGCSGSETGETIVANEQEVAGDLSGNSAAAAEAGANAASDEPAICRNFKSRENDTGTLHGIAIGDTVEQVTQQLTCISNPHTLGITHENGVGPDVEMPSGQKGIKFVSGEQRSPLSSQYVTAHFVGVPGSERVIGVSSSGSFDDDGKPSLQQFSNSLLKQHPLARRYEPGVDGAMANRTTIGYGSSADGVRFSNRRALDGCARTEMVRPQCGLSYSVQLVVNYNSNELVTGFFATLVDWSYAIKKIAATETEVRNATAQFNREQLKAAEKRSGPSGL